MILTRLAEQLSFYSKLDGMIISALLLFAALLSPDPAVPHDKSAIIADVRAGKYEEACHKLQLAIKTSPQDASLWTLNGYALAHLDKQAEALASYKHALAISPDYVPALEGAAQLEYQAAHQSAVPLLEKILTIKPGDETSHGMLATLAFERHDCNTAVREFEYSRTLISSSPSSLEEYGACLLEIQKPEEAVKIFERVSVMKPDNDKARYNLGLAQVLAKQYRDAVATLKPLVASRPNDGNCLDVLAQAYEGLLDTPNAVASLRQAIASNPDVPQYYLDFADISLVHMAYQVGINMLNVALKRMPNTAALYLARGILYVQQADFARSRQDFERAEQLDPELQYGRGIQGLADLQANDMPRAKDDVRRRLSQSPNDAFLCYLLAEILTREGARTGSPQFQEAVKSAEKAVQLRPRFPVARNLLSRLYLEQGRTDDAIKQSRLAYDEDPKGQTAQTALYHLIAALRKSGNVDEIPSLSKKLADLREELRAKETAEHRYALLEVSRPESQHQ